MEQITLKKGNITPYQKACMEMNVLTEERKGLYAEMEKLNCRITDINQRINSKKDTLEKIKAAKPEGLSLTCHAIERFKQRVADLPDERVEQLLLSEECIKRHKDLGNGRYRIKPKSSVYIAVANNKIITVINHTYRLDKKPKIKFKYLSSWMDEVIEATYQKVVNKVNMEIPTFEQYFKENFTI